MLGLGIDVDIDIKKLSMPFYFEHKNECVHCGAKDQLVFVDVLGRETTKEINAFDHIKCKACGKKYSIMWTPDTNKEENKLYPSAVDPSIKTDFMNMVSSSRLKQQGEKNI